VSGFQNSANIAHICRMRFLSGGLELGAHGEEYAPAALKTI